jgi:hypothetical protein
LTNGKFCGTIELERKNKNRTFVLFLFLFVISIIPQKGENVKSFFKKILHKKKEFFIKFFVQCAQMQISGASALTNKKKGFKNPFAFVVLRKLLS